MACLSPQILIKCEKRDQEDEAVVEASSIHYVDIKLKPEHLDYLSHSMDIKNEENHMAHEDTNISPKPHEWKSVKIEEEKINYVDVNNILANGNDRFKCPHCMYKTKWKHSLNLHITNIHTASDEIKWFMCDYCPYKGKTKDHLNKHLLRHHEIKWHVCTQCPFKSKRKQGLDFHVVSKHKSGEEINWFRCNYCTHKAKLKKYIIEHTRAMHIGDVQWYKCQLCPYKTKKNANLKSHVNNIHTSEDEILWFRCELCSYKSKRKPDLKRHLKKHSDDGV